ncbi:DNA-3-methyladenine glycosylase I [Fervidibacillus halotolerans]|uniref:DNA-3-methyladenine glycosylase I n=1 Tax=Fervidibacillus halotolerans TaxID=2980027 RepID=A0A9E8M1G0_9BACI|nr:DNA-3-methyladenine glycosylase I [Fervidibacillus halotolerans]WAA13489.1 DNA-3-methyladenine glycosylase I [Fervidibacillus halotolerans]
MNRCSWVTSDPLYIDYHDQEWGNPVFSDQKLFELLLLESAQAGLSWITILKKRESYRKAFDQFDPEKIAQYNEDKIRQLLLNPGIVRNEKKIRSAIQNAKAFLKIQQQFGTFSNYLWNFVDGKPIVNHWESFNQVPTETELSKKISKDLKSRGFSFVGPTIIYSYLQAIGIVNDHEITCFRHPSNLQEI